MADLPYPIRTPLRHPIYDGCKFYVPVIPLREGSNKLQDLSQNLITSDPGVGDPAIPQITAVPGISQHREGFSSSLPRSAHPFRSSGWIDFDNVSFDASRCSIEFTFELNYYQNVSHDHFLFGGRGTGNSLGALSYHPNGPANLTLGYMEWHQDGVPGIFDPGEQPNFSTPTPPGEVWTNTKNHVVFTHEDNNVDQIWVNGRLLVENNAPYSMTCVRQTLCMYARISYTNPADRESGWDMTDDSYIDEISIYEKVLTRGEIIGRANDQRTRTQYRNGSWHMSFDFPVYVRYFVNRINPFPPELRGI